MKDDDRQNDDLSSLAPDLGALGATEGGEEVILIILAMIAGGFLIYGAYVAGRWAYRQISGVTSAESARR